jgi:hypothetical protein
VPNDVGKFSRWLFNFLRKIGNRLVFRNVVLVLCFMECLIEGEVNHVCKPKCSTRLSSSEPCLVDFRSYFTWESIRNLLTLKNVTVMTSTNRWTLAFPYALYVSFVWLSQERAIILLNKFNRLTVAIEM